MFYDRIRTAQDALSYFTECQLATVADLAMKKSRGKYDYARHIDIAQKMLNQCVQFGVNYSTTRVEEIIEHYHSNVKAWAMKYEK